MKIDHEEAFAYYVENQQALRRLVSGVLRGLKTYRVDEIMSDVVLVRLPGLLARVDESLGDRDAYVNTSLRWYVFKYLDRVQDRRNLREIGVGDLLGQWEETTQAGKWTSEDDADASERSASDAEKHPETSDDTADRLDDYARCAMLVERLSREQLMILRRRFVEDLQVDEICRLMAVGRTTFYVRLGEALDAARRVLGDE